MRKKGSKVSLKSREWVIAKKERRQRQGKGCACMTIMHGALIIFPHVTEVSVWIPNTLEGEENHIFDCNTCVYNLYSVISVEWLGHC